MVSDIISRLTHFRGLNCLFLLPFVAQGYWKLYFLGF